ncbi:Alkaline phosphatase synthesis sensor protein PhoR [compost metagenome]
MTAPHRPTGEPASDATSPLDLAAEAATDALYAFDCRTDSFSWREGASGRLSAGPAEPGLAGWRALLHPDDAERVIGAWESAMGLKTRHWELEYRVRRLDGTWAHVVDRGRAWLDESGQAIGALGGLVDVTERRWAERALRESEERYRRMVELSPDSVVVHSEGRIVYVNAQTLKLLGASHPSEVVGTPVAERVHPDYRELAAERIRRMMTNRSVEPLIEEVMLRMDGTAVDVEVAAAPIVFQGKPGILVVGRDIGDRKRAESQIAHQKAALEDANQRLRDHAARVEAEVAQRTRELASQKAMTERIIANAPAGLGFIDTTLTFRWLNATLANFLQVSAERLVGRPLFEVIPEVKDQFGPILQGVIDTGEPFHATAAPFVYTVDGVERTTYWDYTYMPAVDEAGTVIGLLVLNHEVSARVEQARMLQEQIEKLHELDRLKASFINTVTHELRTPLTSIRGYAEFMEDGIGGDLSEDHRGFVDQIQYGALRLQRLVDDLLDFARLEAGTFQLVVQEGDMVALLQQEVMSLLPQVRDRDLSLEVNLPPGPLKVRMDAPRIGQVLLNLVGNAIKFTRPGGRVDVSLQVEPGRLRVAVADTGIGIPREHMPQLFQKFYQVDPSITREFGGAGLGLSIARALVEAHGGEMGVESVVGEGSTFWFTLPTP